MWKTEKSKHETEQGGMHRRHHPGSISGQEGLETPLNETRMAGGLVQEVMGQAIARYTGDVFVKNQVLYVL